MAIDTVFVFIMAIIIIGFLLVFGTNILGPFIQTSSDAQLIIEMNRLDSAICKSSDGECRGGCFWTCSEGSGIEVEFVVPSGFTRVCFFDPENPSPNPAGGWEGDVFLENIIERGGYNVVPLINDNIVTDLSRKIPKLKPSENFCIEPGRNKLWVTNLGSRLDIQDLS